MIFERRDILIQSKLFSLYDDPNFATDAIDFDTGVMINEYGDAILYLVLQYAENHFHVYLSLCDDGNPPYRDIMAEGIATTLEAAQDIAVKNLNKLSYGK